MEFPNIALCSLLFLFIAWYFKHNKKIRISNNWGIVRSLVIIKNANSAIEMVTAMFDTFGETFRVKNPIFTSMNYVFTCNPDNIEYVLKTNFSNFRRGSAFPEIFDIFGKGLFNTDSHLQEWFTGRKLLHGWFSSKEFRTFSGDVSRLEVESALLPLLLHHVKESLVVDLQDVIQRLTNDTSFTMVFGINPKLLQVSFPVNEFMESMDVAMNTLVYRHIVPITLWKFWRLLNVGWEGRNSTARKTIDHILGEMISRKKEEMDKGVGQCNDLLTKFMACQGNDQNNNSLRDFAFGAILAIGDTTASGLTWFFWLVSQTPRVEAKILGELRQITCGCERSTTLKMKVFDQNELENLVYLHAALCESLRLYPPVSTNHRAAVKADVLPDGKRIRPGTKVILSVYASARSKSTWGEDCMDFKPERWINEDGMFRSELMSKFFSFSAGPRSCMGKHIGFNSMKVVVSAVLFNFHVQVVECRPDSLQQSMILFMKNGLKVKITERTDPT